VRLTDDIQMLRADRRRDYGDLIGDAEDEDEGEIVEANGNSDQMDTEDSMQETDDIGRDIQAEPQPQVRHSNMHTTCRSLIDRRQETAASEAQNQSQPASAGAAAPPDSTFAAMPQALLATGTFRD
jgi:hypothetical protein